MSSKEDSVPTNVPQKRKRFGQRFFVNVLAVIGALSLLAGAAVLVYSFVVDTDSRWTTSDPQRIEQIRAEIATIELPADFSPEKGMEVTPFAIKYAIYQGAQEPTVLLLVSVHEAGASAEKLEAKMKQALPEMGRKYTGFKVAVENPEVRQVVIDGQPADFEFGEGKEEQTQRDCRQVVGTFQGPLGTTGVFLIADKETMTEEQVAEMIASLK